MLIIRPYLTFSGECQEAIELYKKAFNTQVTEIMRFSEIPQDPKNPIPENQENWILQATLPFGDNFMRLSDTFKEVNDTPSERVSIAVEGSATDIEHAFNILSDEGSIVMSLQETFFSPAFGSLYDKFGVMWTLAATENL